MEKFMSFIQKMKSKFSSERGDIGETLTIVFVAVCAIGIMTVLPLMQVADSNDDVAQLVVQSATTDFINDVRTTGILNMDKYSKFVQDISSTGYAYDVSIELGILDENPGKKVTQVESTKIGENLYYWYYNSQTMDLMNPSSGETRTIALKEGDMIKVTVTSRGSNISEQLSGWAYQTSDVDTSSTVAEGSGLVTVDGKEE